MLKRIAVAQLQSGMFVQELCGSWMDHPFWKSAFLIDHEEDLRRLLESGIKEAWIDTDKGLDTTDGCAKEVVEQQIDRLLDIAEASPAIAVRPTGLAEELSRAAGIVAESRKAVVSMFQEARMGNAIRADAVRPLVEEIGVSLARNREALIGLARLKTSDDYTYMHSVAVCALMISLARQMGLDEESVSEAGLAGLLHDIGKMAVPAEILNKPGKLTDAEFAIVKTHTVEGEKMLSMGAGISDIARDVCLHHHEKVNGGGYPHQLRSAQISRFAKMGAVCDVYDAVTSERPYNKGWEPAEAIRKMAEWSTWHFDEVIFQAFVKAVGIYPVGSLVRLRSGRLGVIVGQSEKSLLTPVIKVFFSVTVGARIAPETQDLSAPACTDRITNREDPAAWGITDLDQLWRGATA
ncbi:MAG: HD-GYP domain-containing protein [Betaproteobacteria bacterium]